MITLAQAIEALGRIAPLEYGEKWDNIGLLLEPPGVGPIRRVFFTIDLTESVLDEALEAKTDLIVAYHPPIFGGLKRITRRTALERSIGRCMAARLPIYSPHSALDAAVGGMNDWLAQGVGPAAEVTPLKPHLARGEVVPGVGAGRRITLEEPAGINSIVERLKAHLGLGALRLAAAEGHAQGQAIETVAVCPGAGGSLFEGVSGVDLLVTGEMRHHDVLARVAQGVSVVLTDHTNTERGYLPHFADTFAQMTGLTTLVSTRDADPLVVV